MIIQQWQAYGRPSESLLEDEPYRLAKENGITSLQSYVHWSEVEVAPGIYDFSLYDPVVERIRKHGLRWTPFVIAGPYYSTPEWFRNSEENVFAKCLEHDTETVIQSIWNPNLQKHVKGFLRSISEHFESELLESVLLGISGNWGETIFPAGGGFKWKPEFHTHIGWWAGDTHAIESHRSYLKAKYLSLQNLNRAWSAEYTDWESILPDAVECAPGFQVNASLANRRLDFVEWYIDSMNHYCEMWLRSAREVFPDTEIYLVTGGEGEPQLGADFALQTKIASKYNAGVRITNQNDSYEYSFASTRMISSSSRFYSSYYTTEPGGANTSQGVPMRVFDMLTGGARGMYFKMLLENVGPGRDSCKPTDLLSEFARNEEFLALECGDAIIKVGVLYPTTAINLFSYEVLRPLLLYSGKLRDAIDFDFIDETMICDGALSKYVILISLVPSVIKTQTFDIISSWCRNSGLVITSSLAPIQDVASQESLIGRDDLNYDAKNDNAIMEYLDFISKTIMSNDLLEAVKIDGESDGVYTSVFDNGIFLYSTNQLPVTKEYSYKGRTGKVEIPPNSLKWISVGQFC